MTRGMTKTNHEKRICVGCVCVGGGSWGGRGGGTIFQKRETNVMYLVMYLMMMTMIRKSHSTFSNV